jgi:hypothetical protein
MKQVPLLSPIYDVCVCGHERRSHCHQEGTSFGHCFCECAGFTSPFSDAPCEAEELTLP